MTLVNQVQINLEDVQEIESQYTTKWLNTVVAQRIDTDYNNLSVSEIKTIAKANPKVEIVVEAINYARNYAKTNSKRFWAIVVYLLDAVNFGIDEESNDNTYDYVETENSINGITYRVNVLGDYLYDGDYTIDEGMLYEHEFTAVSDVDADYKIKDDSTIKTFLSKEFCCITVDKLSEDNKLVKSWYVKHRGDTEYTQGLHRKEFERSNFYYCMVEESIENVRHPHLDNGYNTTWFLDRTAHES